MQERFTFFEGSGETLAEATQVAETQFSAWIDDAPHLEFTQRSSQWHVARGQHHILVTVFYKVTDTSHPASKYF